MRQPVEGRFVELVDASDANEPGDHRLPPVGPDTPDPRE